MHAMLRNKKKLAVNFGDDILISTLITTVESRVKNESIMKLKHYMQNGLSIINQVL